MRPLGDFYGKADTSDGLHSWCKHCTRQAARDRKLLSKDRPEKEGITGASTMVMKIALARSDSQF
ncbi:MAG: hypothetical protein WAN81_09590, partial [Candidatus Binataceae bacterium]